MKLLALCTCIVLGACAVGNAQRAGTQAPEVVVEAFAKAISDGDLTAAAAMVKGGRTDADFQEIAREYPKPPVAISVSVFQTFVAGDKGMCGCDLLEVPTVGNVHWGFRAYDPLRLERIDNAWKIVPPDLETTRSDLSAYARVLAGHGPDSGHGRAVADAEQCGWRIRRLCLAFAFVAADDPKLSKVKPDAWKNAIKPYVESEAFFHCPDDKSGNVSYSLNPVGKSAWASSPLSEETVLFYEGRKMKLDYRHNSRACVGFMDGRSRLVTPAEAKRLRWNP